MTSFLLLAMAMGAAGADTFNLSTGETVVGELLLTSANDIGIQIKVGEGEYKRISWSSFSQEDLKRLSGNAKLQGFVEPFIEVSQEERMRKTDVNPVPPERLALPVRQSLFGAIFSSALGLAVVLILYAANIYAGFEVAIYRGRPALLVCGVSAVLPFIGPLIFLARKTEVRSDSVPEEASPSAKSATETSQTFGAGSADSGNVVPQDDVNPMRAEGAVHPTLHITHEEPKKKAAVAPTVFQRGQFTFNRRFFETRFAGFFGVVKKEAEKDNVLVFKTMRGEFVGERISRIAGSELHLQIRKGDATEEVMIPFSEVQEIRHQHKNV